MNIQTSIEKFRSSDIPSYYEASRNINVAYPILEQDVEADVCIIGAGFTGINTAIELAESGASVVVLEANCVGWGASGRNGGQAICGIGHDPELVHSVVGDEGLDKLYEMGLKAIQTLKARIDKYNIQCDFTWGYCTVSYKQRAFEKLKGMHELLQSKGYPADLELLEGASIRKVVGSDRYVGGLLDMGSAHLHPLNLVLGEAVAAASLGAKIFEKSKVSSIEYGEKVTVRTERGSVRARNLVFACNAYLNNLNTNLSNKFVATNAFIVSTEPLQESVASEILPMNTAICDNRPVIDFYRLSADRRLLFGGATHFIEYEPKDLEAHLRKKMLKVFPQLGNIRIDHAWIGKMAVGANLFPQIGRLPDHLNVYHAQAYAGFGVGPTHMAAKMITGDIISRSPDFELVSRIPHMNILGARKLNNFWLTCGKLWHQLEALYK